MSKYTKKTIQYGGLNECTSNCGRSSCSGYTNCCPSCQAINGPHTVLCNTNTAKCKNNCNHYANVGKGYSTCCSNCKGTQGPHSNICNQRNVINTNQLPVIQHISETISLDQLSSPQNRSVLINKTSNLYNILSQIRSQIGLLPNYSPGRMDFHIELVDNGSDMINKANNFSLINNNVQIDLCDKQNWYCQGGAFSLKIGLYSGHFTPLHITIGYFGKNGCVNVLPNCYKIVESVINKKLH